MKERFHLPGKFPIGYQVCWIIETFAFQFEVSYGLVQSPIGNLDHIDSIY